MMLNAPSFGRAIRARHNPSGETALIRKTGERGLCAVQFDRFDHKHSHEWHLYTRRDFTPLKRPWRRLAQKAGS